MRRCVRPPRGVRRTGFRSVKDPFTDLHTDFADTLPFGTGGVSSANTGHGRSNSGQDPPGIERISGLPRPIARVLALLEILQGGGTRTVAELARRLDVDERTVRRYVEHLLDLDVPVRSVPLRRLPARARVSDAAADAYRGRSARGRAWPRRRAASRSDHHLGRGRRERCCEGPACPARGRRWLLMGPGLARLPDHLFQERGGGLPGTRMRDIAPVPRLHQMQ
ncbi:HTH domain-containing protein [Amycolatopsis sulphurea]|uniref:HTH domain-containing protein n=1 Tax=Amycolatopsis sulphurea TaxID=76022 RepID=A0A2A9F8M0_9PSEU|nr:HTH domain-containing protein [Amycolatopsis sulphurea]